ncbi:hypothetical protein KUF71_007026 [Frankliniella fusca]|uniref:Uncharacterized protein n=1 Tax=Frankliniella fusca TaxID=407009 RepID=A0AAE1HA17_9NEOP|nr:hypothetical protein KUF71_007026 [Frankliniella fusca]
MPCHSTIWIIVLWVNLSSQWLMLTILKAKNLSENMCSISQYMLAFRKHIIVMEQTMTEWAPL